MLKALEAKAKETGHALMMAKRKDGAWVIFLSPGAEDPTRLLLHAAATITQHD